MLEYNNIIYPYGRRSPTFNIHGNNYSFQTPKDRGTGKNLGSLIIFDLAILSLTCLPAIAHDSLLFKNIEDTALEHIIELYSKSEKQIFIAIDKLSSYSEKINETVEKNKFLQLSANKLLFTKNWKLLDVK